MEALHSRRTYDYRIQEAICESGDRDLFPELNIPRLTILPELLPIQVPPDAAEAEASFHKALEVARSQWTAANQDYRRTPKDPAISMRYA